MERTPEDQLAHHGLTWERLEKLARKALHDAKRQRNSTLDDGRDRAAADYLFDVGLVWAYRYDPALANGVSFATSVYRRMVMRYPDFLRHQSGDPRTGTPLTLVFVDQMPDGATLDEETFAQLVEEVSGGLTSRALWTLHHIVKPRVVDGTPLSESASQYRLRSTEAQRLLNELGQQLGHTPRTRIDRADKDFAFMDTSSFAA